MMGDDRRLDFGRLSARETQPARDAEPLVAAPSALSMPAMASPIVQPISSTPITLAKEPIALTLAPTPTVIAQGTGDIEMTKVQVP